MEDWQRIGLYLSILVVFCAGVIGIWNTNYAVGEIPVKDLTQLGIKVALTLLEIIVFLLLMLGVFVNSNRKKINSALNRLRKLERQRISRRRRR